MHLYPKILDPPRQFPAGNGFPALRAKGLAAHPLQWLCWALLLALSPFIAPSATLTVGPVVTFTNAAQPVIQWTTDVATGSRVFYGESASQLTRRAEGNQGLEHTVTLPSLPPGTRWFYTVGTARYPLSTNAFTVPAGTQNERAPPASPRPATSKGLTKTPKPAAVSESAPKPPPTRETWGNLPSLADHFERHGPDFHAQNADDYARMAWEFLQRARREGLPTKVDNDGVIRVYDPKTGAFGAYNRNGTTKTYFKPNSRTYFERQPGKLLKPKGTN